MLCNTLLAASALASLVSAIPLAQPPFPKRDIVWETHTEVALTTIPVTVTHWLEPGETAPADANIAPAANAGGNKQHYGHHGHGHSQSHGGYGAPQQPPAQPETTQTAAAAPPASSPASAPPAPPAPSSYEQPTTQAPPPPAAPTTQASPPAYTPPAQPTPQPSPEPAPSAPSSGDSGSAPSGKEYTGDITHYDVGLGSCGSTHSNSDAVVAIPEGIMNNPANPNANPLCGQTITIEYAGQEHTAEIVDTCGGCYATSIDLSPTLFEAVAPKGDGRVSDVKWWFNN